MKAYEKEIDEKDFEDQLNEIYGTVEICGMEMDQGTVLKECDPIAFRCAMSDEPIVWVCDECGSEFGDQDEANECCFEEPDAKEFEYFINLDERGEFYADVRDEYGKTVFEIKGFDFFENGFMSDKEDIDGLRDYLIDVKIMTDEDDLIEGN